MRLKRFDIRNVRSFGRATSIQFGARVTLLIGPNAGGKSNLLDSINITLNHFFIHPWRLREERDAYGIVTRRYYENRREIYTPLPGLLDKHFDHVAEDQKITLVLELRAADVENIKFFIEHYDRLARFEADHYQNPQLPKVFRLTLEGITQDRIDRLKDHGFTFETNISGGIDPILSPDHSEDDERDIRILTSYLNSYELFRSLIRDHNERYPDSYPVPLHPPLTYYSPYRAPENTNLSTRLAGTDMDGMYETYKSSTSRKSSAMMDYANHVFARKLRLLNNDEARFYRDPVISDFNKHLKKLGYDGIRYREVDPVNNIYQAGISINGHAVDLGKASSGEKEIIHLLMGIFAHNVKEGVVIIDEPELHLHPRWQVMLLELCYQLSEDRDTQFILITHSPHLLTMKSIHDVRRVSVTKGNSECIEPPELNAVENDLFQLLDVFNNTKIFFADCVILVEGDVDRIICETILDLLNAGRDRVAIYEVLDVGGKNNFKKYQSFVNKWKIRNHIIADAGVVTDGLTNIAVLSQNDIGDFFPGISQGKFKIEDGLRAANELRSGGRPIPTELVDAIRPILNA